VRRLIRAVGRHLLNRAKAFGPEVIQTAQTKVSQGANEVANMLFTGQAYMPWPGAKQETVNQQATRAADVQAATARITQQRAAASDNAHRAQFQNRDPSRGMER